MLHWLRCQSHLLEPPSLGTWLLFLIDLRSAPARARFIECIVQGHGMLSCPDCSSLAPSHEQCAVLMIASGVEGDPRCMQLGMCGSPRLPDQAILITRDEIPKASSPEANSHAGRVPCLTQMKREGSQFELFASSHHCLERFGDSVDGSQCRSALILSLSDAN